MSGIQTWQRCFFLKPSFLMVFLTNSLPGELCCFEVPFGTHSLFFPPSPFVLSFDCWATSFFFSSQTVSLSASAQSVGENRFLFLTVACALVFPMSLAQTFRTTIRTRTISYRRHCLIFSSTVKLIVKIFKITTDNTLLTNQRNAPILVAINNRTMNFVAMAFEDITKIHSMNSRMEKLHRFSERYLAKYLLKNPTTTISKRQILDSYERSCKNAINNPGTRIDWLKCSQKKQLNELRSVKVNENYSLNSAFNRYKAILNRKTHCKNSNKNQASFSGRLSK